MITWDELFPRDYNGPIHKLAELAGHNCYLYYYGEGEYQAKCECGSHWSYRSSATMEYMQSVFESHIRYFNRPKLETL